MRRNQIVFGTALAVVLAASALGGALFRSGADPSSLKLPALGAASTAIDPQVLTDETVASWPYPRDLAELLSKADVVVTGSVERIAFVGDVAPYDAGPSYTGRRIRVSDYEIRPERVLLDDGTVATGRALVVRVLGSPGPDEARMPFLLPKVGERSLFFLKVHPDRATYGLYFPAASRILLDGAVVTYSDRGRAPVPFAPTASPQQFIELVASNISSR